MMSAIFSLLIIAVAICLLAIITDEYFIESLDQISRRWRMPPNVAGASLMAMGSSAPELAIALLALFNDGGAHGDLGIGTIVGSAVFNVLIITGFSAIVKPAAISWRVVVRDVVMYVASIGLLFATFSDSIITIREALSFLALYGVYIFILYQWDAFAPGGEFNVVETVERRLHGRPDNMSFAGRIHRFVAGTIGKATGDPNHDFVRSFAVSIVLIAGLSWVLVEQAVIFADAVGIPTVVVALTILAGGTSVPDLLASIIVAKDGRGEMAVANAIGSNIFDILICLGLPWLIALLVFGDSVQVSTDRLWTSTIILLATVILLFILSSTGRVLTRVEGWILVCIYTIYVLWMVFMS